MAIYSKFLSLINGANRTVDLSTNTLSVQGLQINAATGGGAITQAAHSTTSSYSVIWPQAQAGGSNYVLANDGSGNLSWISGSSGSVTSVALADGSSTPIYTISNSPVTSTGTLTFTLNAQSANLVFAGPATGSDDEPGFRALVADDIPDLSAVYVTQSEVGAANGVASLDSGGHIPLSQLPASLVEYKGTWDASTNTPTLANGTGVAGWFYITSVAGTVDFGAGDIAFNEGDWVLYDGSIWERAVQSNIVQSVNGQTGVVTVDAINQLTGDVTATAASGSQSKATTVAAIQGVTVSGTTGTGNVVFSAAPTLTGLLSGGSASFSSTIAASNFSGSSNGTNTGDQTITLTGDVTGSGTGSFATTIGAGKVLASMLSTVTDGVTLDQSGAGATLEIKDAGVSADQLATGAFDQVTILGGAGTPASVVSSPVQSSAEVAGEALSATTLVALRYALAADSGFVAGRMYKADYDSTSADNFNVVGLAYPASGVSAAGAVSIVESGIINAPSHGFTVGKPVYLSASGAITGTAPSTALQAVVKVGMVKDADNISVQIQVIGIN